MNRTYSHIDLDERRKIARRRMAGIGVGIIAEKLGRHRSTIFRESATCSSTRSYRISAATIADIRRFVRKVHAAFPDFTMRLNSEIIKGNRASAEWEMTGTNGGELLGLPATDRSVSVRGESVFEIEAGRFKRCSDYCNLGSVLKQLGLA
jgi:steroid delta-isomerase-like uncharacterized protein